MFRLIDPGDKLQYTQCKVNIPYLPASSFGDDVRPLAISKGGNEVLPLGEKIRDSLLVLLRVALESG